MDRRARAGAAVTVVVACACVLWALLSSDGAGGSGDVLAPSMDDGPVMRLDAIERDGEARPLLAEDAPIDTPGLAAAHAAAAGEPIPRGSGDVLVEVFFADGRPAPHIDLKVMVWGPGGSGSGEPRRGFSDEHGVARFADLRRGAVVAYSDRNGSTSGELRPGEELRLRLDLDAGHLLHGWVVDAEGRPVAGAGIWLSSHFNPDNGTLVTESAADGSFRVEAVSEARYVGATLPPCVPSPLRLLSEPEHFEEPLTLQLGERGARLIADVIDQTRLEPVAGATVIVGGERGWSVPRGDDGRSEGQPPREARSDAAGRVVFEGLPPGRTRLMARADDLAPGSRGITLTLDEPLTVTIPLAPGCTLRGTLRDEAGLPVAGATITTGEWGSFLGRTTRSDSDGRYVLDGLVAGEVGFGVEHPECLPAHTLLTLAPDEPSVWSPVLVRGAVIDGRVTDAETGEPVEQMLIAAIPPGGELLFRASARSDADGRFRLAGLEDAEYDVLALHLGETGFAEAARVERVRPGATLELRAEPAREPGRVVGQLLDDLDQPPHDAWIKLVPADGRGLEQAVRVEPDGRFELPRVNPGLHALVAMLREPLGLPDIGQVEVRERETTDLGLLRLVPGGRLRVRLLARGGVDLSGLRLGLRGADLWTRGSLEIDGAEATGSAAAGAYDLVCTGKGVAAQRVPVTLESGLEMLVDLDVQPGVLQRLDLRARPGGNMIDLGWRVVDARGRLVLDRPSSRTRAESLGASLYLAPGAYVLHATQAGLARPPQPFEVGPQPGPALVLEMQ